MCNGADWWFPSLWCQFQVVKGRIVLRPSGPPSIKETSKKLKSLSSSLNICNILLHDKTGHVWKWVCIVLWTLYLSNKPSWNAYRTTTFKMSVCCKTWANWSTKSGLFSHLFQSTCKMSWKYILRLRGTCCVKKPSERMSFLHMICYYAKLFLRSNERFFDSWFKEDFFSFGDTNPNSRSYVT